MSKGSNNYAGILGLARRFRDGTQPLAAATNQALRKEVISGTPKDPAERPPPPPKNDHQAAR